MGIGFGEGPACFVEDLPGVSGDRASLTMPVPDLTEHTLNSFCKGRTLHSFVRDPKTSLDINKTRQIAQEIIKVRGTQQPEGGFLAALWSFLLCSHMCWGRVWLPALPLLDGALQGGTSLLPCLSCLLIAGALHLLGIVRIEERNSAGSKNNPAPGHTSCVVLARLLSLSEPWLSTL